MAKWTEKLVRDLVKAFKESNANKTGAYDTPATVTRIENGTAWVHIPGGVDETPVKLTVNAKTGDTVQLRVANGTAWITGNATSPPTDDTAADFALKTANAVGKAAGVARSVADSANTIAKEAHQIATANNQHFYSDESGAHVDFDKEDGTCYNSLWNSLGMLFRKGPNNLVSISESAVAFYDGNGNAAGNIVSSFGKSGIQIGNNSNTKITLDNTSGLKLGNSVVISTSGNATFSGAVNASSGKIGGFAISSTSNSGSTSANGGHAYKDSLYGHSGDGTYEYEVGMKSDANSTSAGSGYLAFYVKRITAGSTWANPTNVFYVTHAGKLYAADAEISGTITGSSGEFTKAFKVRTPLTTSGYYMLMENGRAYGKDYVRVGSEYNGSFAAGIYVERGYATLTADDGVSINSNVKDVGIYGKKAVDIATDGDFNLWTNNGKAYINGFQLLKTVPANAVFTDTTYSNATTSKAGLMSANDKAILSGHGKKVGDSWTVNVYTAGYVTSGGSAYHFIVPLPPTASGTLTATLTDVTIRQSGDKLKDKSYSTVTCSHFSGFAHIAFTDNSANSTITNNSPVGVQATVKFTLS